MRTIFRTIINLYDIMGSTRYTFDVLFHRCLLVKGLARAATKAAP